MASFSTVSLIRETPAVLLRFAGHYLAAGADEVMLYWDGDDPPEVLRTPGLSLVACDPAFWAALGGRPAGLEARQAAVYGVAMARCASDWLLVCDADEFVFGDRPLAAWLDLIPSGEDAVRLPVAEAVWGPGDDPARDWGSTHFRTVWPSEKLWRLLGRPIYGEVAGFMRRGLLGHIEGKQVLRAGRRYSAIRNMAAERDGQRLGRPAASVAPALTGQWLGHFDAIGFERWREKWRRRIERETLAENMSPGRNAQMALVADRLASGRGEALFAAFYGLSRGQVAALRGLGRCFRRPDWDAGGR